MKPLHAILAIAISLIWGLNFVAAKSAVGHFPTFFLLAMRLTIVIIILLPFVKKPILPIKQLFKISVTFTVFHFGLMFSSLEYGLDAAVAVVIDQLRVPFAVTLGYFLLGDTIQKKGILGIAIALLGTFVLVGTPNIINNYAAFWMIVGGAVAWALYNIQVKNLKDVDPLAFIFWISLFGAPQLYIISFLIESNHIELIRTASALDIASLFYIAIASTVVAHGFWYYLIQRYSLNIAVPYSLLVPVFGMMSGVLLLDEIMTWHIIVGGTMTIIGVFIVVIKKPRSAKGGDIT